jgi:hypothetical protein
MPSPPHLSICNMANERQVADDSIYIENGGKIDVREFSFVVGNNWRDNDSRYFLPLSAVFGSYQRKLS